MHYYTQLQYNMFHTMIWVTADSEQLNIQKDLKKNKSIESSYKKTLVLRDTLKDIFSIDSHQEQTV